MQIDNFIAGTERTGLYFQKRKKRVIWLIRQKRNTNKNNFKNEPK